MRFQAQYALFESFLAFAVVGVARFASVGHCRQTAHCDSITSTPWKANTRISSDYPDEKLRTIRWLGEGSYRVWQNRLRAPRWTRMKLRGEHWEYFARLSWARLDWVTSARPDHYSRIGTPRFDEHEPGFSGG